MNYIILVYLYECIDRMIGIALFVRAYWSLVYILLYFSGEKKMHKNKIEFISCFFGFVWIKHDISSRNVSYSQI